MKHTPGPWCFEPHYGYGTDEPDGTPCPFGYLSTQHPSPFFVLGTFLAHDYDELRANALLAASAPDMFAALEEIIALDENSIRRSSALVRAADIARAVIETQKFIDTE